MKKTRGYVIVAHCVCWIIFLSLPVIFVAGNDGDILYILSKPLDWLKFALYILIFYFHTYILLPKFFFEKKYLLYVSCIVLFALSVFQLHPFDTLMKAKEKGHHSIKASGNHRSNIDRDILLLNYKINQPGPFKISPELKMQHKHLKFDIVSTILFILIIAISFTFALSKRWRIAIELAQQAEADKTTAELVILKAQINPHFLFNTLNNIYSQAIMKDEHTPESILKLSNIMRYVIDEAKETFVSLQSEIAFISDYIALQKLRLSGKVQVDFRMSGNVENKIIAPLILLTFIENVFKYGISNSEPFPISIDLKIDEANISLLCRNKIFLSRENKEGTHIGIINTRKRLEHLYPGKYYLEIKENDGFYNVVLKLPV